jgi:hypothetical protein
MSLRSDRLAHPHPIAGHQLVPEGPDYSGRDHPRNLIDEKRLDEALCRLPDHQACRHRDRDHDHQAGPVLDPVEPIGVSPSRRPATDREGDPKRDRGQRVGEVVQSVRKEGHRAAEDDDHGLKQRRQAKTDQ